MENIIKSYQRLFNWLKLNNFEGYDPYDGLNNNFFIKKKRNKFLNLTLSNFHKYSIINFRPLFGVKTTIDNQASSLIIKALLKYKPNKDVKNIVEFLLKFIKRKSLKFKYGFHCWNGHNFSIQGRREFQTPEVPGIIGTEACASAFLEYYKIEKKEYIRNILIEVKNFFIKNLLIKNNDFIHFKYKPITPYSWVCYNASIIAANYIAKIGLEFNYPELIKISKDVVDFVIFHQKDNGSWYYSLDLSTGKERKQIDFHQGFIIDSIYEFIKYTKISYDKYMRALKKGIEFYKNEQFLPDGRCKWRWPRVWPIDIHNQAQGIITFAKLSELNNDYLDFAKKIAKWTIDNMQDKSGYFYYQKWPFYTNKIPYMRWGQAWMMLALATLLEKLNEEKN
ncbi:MAG: hypothetical protein ACTSRG_25200 [Candidatus Helarchaeota archaeon]